MKQKGNDSCFTSHSFRSSWAKIFLDFERKIQVAKNKNKKKAKTKKNQWRFHIIITFFSFYIFSLCGTPPVSFLSKNNSLSLSLKVKVYSILIFPMLTTDLFLFCFLFVFSSVRPWGKQVRTGRQKPLQIHFCLFAQRAKHEKKKCRERV